MQGSLVVIEGLDGSGKSTQFEIVDKLLSERNISHKSISFPDYDNPSSALVKMYLSGEFSKNAADVNAFAAASFYAVDRYASYKLYWEKVYKSGDLILASRYVTSNAIYQMVKCEKSEWDSFLDWLFDYEYERLGLPRPDSVIFLDMPISVSQKLLSARYNGDENKKDIHEVDVEFLKRCREAALYTAEKFNWNIIQCSDGENPFPKEKITSEIMKIIDRF
ncbi:MAG: deoxynucleoside kinase [Ruminococcus sp.]|nr:deoxynucleoside kinase [Ruminococcus sp.]